MESKNYGFWQKYSQEAAKIPKESKRNSVMYALWGLNHSVLELYNIMLKPYTNTEFNRYAGYVIRWIVQVDTLKGGCSELSYLQEEVYDPLDKGLLLRVARQISGLAMEHENVTGRENAGLQDFKASWKTDEDLTKTLRRLLKFIMGETTVSLRDLATQHMDIYYGRVPSC